MKYLDRNSNPSRIDPDVRPLVRGLLENTQIFGPETADPSHVTTALKYTQEAQQRRAVSSYDGDDPFIQSIIDVFGFDPLDFQRESWELIDDLNRQRRETGDSQAAIFSAPTGFGKTEAFLGPLYQHLRDDDQEMTILVYPSRALLQDQLGRILEHLYQIKTTSEDQLSVGVWTSDTAYTMDDVETKQELFERSGGERRFRLANCWCGADEDSHSFIFQGGRSNYNLVCEHDESHRFSDQEILLSRESIRHGGHPDVLLTTLESLELFGLKPNYDIVQNADSIVFDETHLYTGMRGAHAANVIENVEAVTDQSLLWLGSSATIDDAERFASKIFPVPGHRIEAVSPPDSDFDTDHNDKEHYYFLKSTEDGPGVSSMFIQQILLLGHALLEDDDGSRGKILSFIDSISQVNQKQTQLVDADRNRELWRYHVGSDDPDDWSVVAEEMGHQFIDEPLDFASIYSDKGFDPADVRSDVLLSTNFLEVGIDVGDISIVTQYRTPWNLSSFVQRVGRAAREPGTDSHVFVFLSDLTSDANMFYRADRFLGSEIRTPLKTDNEVVAWIHEQFRTYYEVVTEVSDRRYMSQNREKAKFHEEFLVDALGWDAYHTFLTDPDAVIPPEFELGVSLDALTGEKPVQEAIEALEATRKDLEAELSALGLDDGSATGDDAVSEILSSIRRDVLEFIAERQELVETCREAEMGVDDELLDRLERQLDDARAELAEPAADPSAELETLYGVQPSLFEATGTVRRLTMAARRADVDTPHLSHEVAEIDEAIDDVADAIDTDRIQEQGRLRKQLYYLLQALEEIEAYQGYGGSHLSLYYIKNLLRGGYYFDRFLRVTGDSLAGEVWFVPENYFDDAGKYFTVFHGPDDTSGSDQSIDKLVHSYTPFRSEYQQDAGHLQAYLPETVVDDGDVRFTFDDVQGERREDLIVPDSITLSDVTDLSGSKGLNIVRYCPECLQILEDSRCLRHNDRSYGKIHASPDVQTSIGDSANPESRGSVTLSDITGTVKLTGASLEITPATYIRSDDEFIFTGGDRIERHVAAPEQTLGFTLDTRGLTFDVSDFLSTVDDEDLRDDLAKYKDLDRVPPREIAAHTAAHFYTQLVADIAGVSPGALFYGIDEEAGEVYVFERSQGGQGIVDLVFEDLREDPGTTLDAVTRIAYNPQVLNERLWANRSFVDALPSADPSREEIEQVVREADETPVFDHVVDLLVEEVQSSVDRARQLAREETFSLRRAFEIKHAVASARIEGNDQYPVGAVEGVVPNFDSHERVETLFFSPDVDGCVDNLHLSECTSGHDQSDTLSYVVLEALRESIVERVPSDEVGDELFEREYLPGGEYDGTSVFLTL